MAQVHFAAVTMMTVLLSGAAHACIPPITTDAALTERSDVVVVGTLTVTKRETKTDKLAPGLVMGVQNGLGIVTVERLEKGDLPAHPLSAYFHLSSSNLCMSGWIPAEDLVQGRIFMNKDQNGLWIVTEVRPVNGASGRE